MFTNPASIDTGVSRGATNPARHIGKCIYPFTDKENRTFARNNMKEIFAQYSDENGLITLANIRDALKSIIRVNGGSCTHGAEVSAALADSFDLAAAAACFHAAFAARKRSNPAASHTADGRSDAKRHNERERFETYGMVDAQVFISMYLERIHRTASRRASYHAHNAAAKLEFESTDFCSLAEMTAALTAIRAPFADIFVDHAASTVNAQFLADDISDDDDDEANAGDTIAMDEAPAVETVAFNTLLGSSKQHSDTASLDWFPSLESIYDSGLVAMDVGDHDQAAPVPIHTADFDPTDPFNMGFSVATSHQREFDTFDPLEFLN